MIFSFFSLVILSCSSYTEESRDIVVAKGDLFSSPENVISYFRYDSSRPDIIVCGHRGGNYPGYPENCIETFLFMHSSSIVFFEVDPRMTKDGIPILLHDDTIDRTTTGKGLAAESSLNDLKSYRLVDRQGRETSYSIPTVEEAILWNSDSVIFNFDYKDVPDDILCKLVVSLGAHNCVFTVHSVSRAKNILSILPDALFSAFIGSPEEYAAYRDADLLSHIVIAYMKSDRIYDFSLVDSLHNKGIRCMVSTAPYEGSGAKSPEYYLSVLESHPDIIETDYPLSIITLPGIRINY